MITPLGWGKDHTWKALLEGKSGAGRITAFDPTDYACKVACEVPRVDGRGGGSPDDPASFNPDLTMAPRDQRRVDDFILYAMAAADEAVKDAGWTPEDEHERERTGVIIGSGIGGLDTIAKTAIELHEKGPRRVNPFFIPSALVNLASGQVSIRYGFKGPNHAVVTACATGAHAIGDATRLIKYGDADVMVGSDCSFMPWRSRLMNTAAMRGRSSGLAVSFSTIEAMTTACSGCSKGRPGWRWAQSCSSRASRSFIMRWSTAARSSPR